MSKLLILNMIRKSLVCRGRRRAPAPRVVMVFVDRWTRWDFRGCTRSTHNGSEGVLRPGWWTWYRASKWTWSTAGESIEKDGSCQGRRRGSAPLAGGKSLCQGQRRVPAPLTAQKCRYPGRIRDPAPLTAQKCRYPRAEKGLSAPGSKEIRLPGAEKGLGAPGGDGFRCQMDEVGFQGVYLVHP